MPPPCPSPLSSFSPPIFCLQLLIDRISTPWEPNFAGIPVVEVHFPPSPSSQSNALSNPNGQIPVGSGRLFFLRASSNGKLGWMEMRGRSAGNLTDWTGRIDLEQLKKNWPSSAAIQRIVCPMECQQQSLEAHLLLSIGEIGKKMGNEQHQEEEEERMAEKGTQTDEWARGDDDGRAEKGGTTTQTAAVEQGGRGMAAPNGRRQFSRRTLLRMLLWMMLKTRREEGGKVGKKNGGAAPLQKTNQCTITRLSIPPEGQHLLRFLSSRSRAQVSQYRDRIGYLSAVHRTVVPAKVREQRGRQFGGNEAKWKEEEGENGRRLILYRRQTVRQSVRSSSSSGLQSMPMESGRSLGIEEEKEKNGKDAKQLEEEERGRRRRGKEEEEGAKRWTTVEEERSHGGGPRRKSPSLAAAVPSKQSKTPASARTNGSSGSVNSGDEVPGTPSESSPSTSSASSSQSISTNSSGQKSASKMSGSSEASQSESSKKSNSSAKTAVASSIRTDCSVPVEMLSVSTVVGSQL